MGIWDFFKKKEVYKDKLEEIEAGNKKLNRLRYKVANVDIKFFEEVEKHFRDLLEKNGFLLLGDSEFDQLSSAQVLAMGAKVKVRFKKEPKKFTLEISDTETDRWLNIFDIIEKLELIEQIDENDAKRSEIIYNRDCFEKYIEDIQIRWMEIW